MTAVKAAALFVDFENVFYALVNAPFGLGRDAALSATLDALVAVRKQLREAGYALLVERSYADWEQLPFTAQRQLQIAGVLPRFTDSKIDKNTADIELSLDILEHMLTRPEVGHVVLVGGDRDYLPILRRLKEQHRSLHVCSLRYTLSGDVREFVANYAGASIIELDELVPPPRATQPKAVAGAAPAELAGEAGEWHERYLEALVRFMREKGYREVHLGPFFRWLQAERVFESLSGAQQLKHPLVFVS